MHDSVDCVVGLSFRIINSSGVLSLIGVKATLIISEVIPFLVLAIGKTHQLISCIIDWYSHLIDNRCR